MKRLMSVVAISMMFCIPVFAESDQGQKPADQDAKEESSGHHITATATGPNAPLPPGLEKHGKTPPGLEKQGKTPKGWSKGKAGWKHPGQTPTGAAGNHGLFGGGNAASHGHSGHGPK